MSRHIRFAVKWLRLLLGWALGTWSAFHHPVRRWKVAVRAMACFWSGYNYNRRHAQRNRLEEVIRAGSSWASLSMQFFMMPAARALIRLRHDPPAGDRACPSRRVRTQGLKSNVRTSSEPLAIVGALGGGGRSYVHSSASAEPSHLLNVLVNELTVRRTLMPASVAVAAGQPEMCYRNAVL